MARWVLGWARTKMARPSGAETERGPWLVRAMESEDGVVETGVSEEVGGGQQLRWACRRQKLEEKPCAAASEGGGRSGGQDRQDARETSGGCSCEGSEAQKEPLKGCWRGIPFSDGGSSAGGRGGGRSTAG